VGGFARGEGLARVAIENGDIERQIGDERVNERCEDGRAAAGSDQQGGCRAAEKEETLAGGLADEIEVGLDFGNCVDGTKPFAKAVVFEARRLIGRKSGQEQSTSASRRSGVARRVAPCALANVPAYIAPIG